MRGANEFKNRYERKMITKETIDERGGLVEEDIWMFVEKATKRELTEAEYKAEEVSEVARQLKEKKFIEDAKLAAEKAAEKKSKKSKSTEEHEDDDTSSESSDSDEETEESSSEEEEESSSEEEPAPRKTKRSKPPSKVAKRVKPAPKQVKKPKPDPQPGY